MEIRAADESDIAAVLELGRASLGWTDDPFHERLFRWKHEQNAFGTSPGWLALDGDRLLGFRIFLRWAFERPDGTSARAVRAVDTATHPDARGRGVFRTLTLHGLEALERDGVDFVFNTPNDQSRPGYLKMGWVELGPVPIGLVPARLASLPALRGARAPADLRSIPVPGGRDAREVLADAAAVAELLGGRHREDTYRTAWTPERLAWRFGLADLHYRAVTLGRDVAEGVAIFRVRRRGTATEATVAEVLVPEQAPRSARRLVRLAARASGADYALVTQRRRRNPAGAIPVPAQVGPRVTWRALNQPVAPTLGTWDLTAGDLELF